jgi:hypothetical protein
MIDKNKKYRLGCVNDYILMDIAYDIVFGRYSRDGKNWHSIRHDLNGVAIDSNVDHNLVEINPYEDWQIDDKVLVWNDPSNKIRRYFAGVSNEGKPMAFGGGATSWSNICKPNMWTFAEKANG